MKKICLITFFFILALTCIQLSAIVMAEGEVSEKVLFVLTNHTELGDTGNETGFYLSEVTHPYHVLIDNGFEIDFVSPKGGQATIDPHSLDLEDPINKAFMEDENFVKKIENTFSPEEIAPEDYMAIFYAGGHGTMWDLPENETLGEIAAAIYENNGVVAAVCHGPAGLLNIRLSDGSYLVKGKKVTSFTNEEEESAKLTKIMPFLLETALIERGAEFIKADNFQENVVISERLVTGQNPASAAGVGEAIIDLLKKESSDETGN